MSAKNSGTHNPFYGRRHTDNTKKKLREIAYRRDYSHLCIPVVVVDESENIIDKLASCKEVSEKYNISRAGLSNSLRKGTYVKGIRIFYNGEDLK